MKDYQEELDNIRELKTKMYVDFVYRVATKVSMIQLESAIDDNLNTLQELVDKATPKKPIYRIADIVSRWGEKEKMPHCPNCDWELSWYYGCSNNNCRQAIDWSEEEKRYRIIVDNTISQLNDCLTLRLSKNTYHFSVFENNDELYQRIFTQQEIDDFPEKIKGAIKCGFLRKVEVNE